MKIYFALKLLDTQYLRTISYPPNFNIGRNYYRENGWQHDVYIILNLMNLKYHIDSLANDNPSIHWFSIPSLNRENSIKDYLTKSCAI